MQKFTSMQRQRKTRSNFIIGFGVLLLILSGLTFLKIQSSKYYQLGMPGKLIPEQNLLVLQHGKKTENQENTPIKASIRLKNIGNEIVHILSVESGCGCTKPISNQSEVLPGKDALIELSAVPPPVGTRDVKIVINTDSKIEKFVNVILRIVSSKTPPYLIGASGDLNFGKMPHDQDTRDISVTAAQTQSETQLPILKTNLSYLDIEHFDQENLPYPDPTAIQVTHRYKVKLQKTLKEPQTGYLQINDPWNGKLVHTFLINITPYDPIQISPQLVILKQDQPQTVLVRSDHELSSIDIVTSENERRPNGIQIKEISKKETNAGFIYIFKLSLDTKYPQPDCSLKIKAIAESNRQIIGGKLAVHVE